MHGDPYIAQELYVQLCRGILFPDTGMCHLASVKQFFLARGL
jgi:hypothetical protein